jgi:integrase
MLPGCGRFVSMPKIVNNALSSMKVRTAGPGVYCDGGGLYLQVKPMKDGQLSRTWTFRYKVGPTKTREMGLGPVRDVSLKEAREKAAELRKKRLAGIDPLAEKETAKAVPPVPLPAKLTTFEEAADAYLDTHKSTWCNPVHARQWRDTIQYANKIIGTMPVRDVDTAAVLSVLRPVWSEKPETASRLRGRLEAVLNAAKTVGLRTGENPAAWRGHLENVLPRLSIAKETKRKKAGRDEHHPALPYAEVPSFMAELRAIEGSVARALEFAVLTAGRPGEVVGARWDEILDGTGGPVWVVPGSRMKAGKEHRVPLSDAAAAIIKAQAAVRRSDYVFPGRPRKPVTVTALLKTLRKMGHSKITTHGMRSAFRDWASETTHHANHVVEMALAHAIPSAVEASYRRGDLLQKRRELMADWGAFASSGEVSKTAAK